MAGLVVGLVAIAAGAGSLVMALQTRRRRRLFAATYASSGGIVYSAVQFGCASLMLLGGVVIMAMVLIGRH
jgi:hypothetical protein